MWTVRLLMLEESDNRKLNVTCALAAVWYVVHGVFGKVSKDSITLGGAGAGFVSTNKRNCHDGT